jgi:PAS domain-containing protein
MASIPLIAGGQTIGNLGISSHQRHQFTNEEKDLLLAIGRETGTAIAKMQAEASYHTIFDSVNDAIAIMDGETGAYLDVNDHMREMFGYTIDELLKLGAGDLTSGTGLSTKAHLRDVLALKRKQKRSLHTAVTDSNMVKLNFFTCYHYKFLKLAFLDLRFLIQERREV